MVERIEGGDAYVLAAPTNFNSISAVLKRFMERLAVYGYWPWGQAAPKLRKSGLIGKKSVTNIVERSTGFSRAVVLCIGPTAAHDG